MAGVDPGPPLRVALIGNPNTGKSTLFSALVGVHQRVGNYPGVTVERKIGRLEYGSRRYELIDLPGLYSLAPRSRDEMVAVDVLLGNDDSRPLDAILCIVDASNLERNLYLASQVFDAGIPVVVALNMVDVAKARGIHVDATRLAQQLGVAVVPVQANRKVGLRELTAALDSVVDRSPKPPTSPLPEAFHREVDRIEALLVRHAGRLTRPHPMPRYLIERLLLDVGGWLQTLLVRESDGEVVRELAASRARLLEAGCPVPGIETEARYRWVREVLRGVIEQPSRHRETVSDHLDRLLTHRVGGMLIFFVVMILIFQSVFVWAEPFRRGIESGMRALGDQVQAHLSRGALQSLIVDGILAGVGAVLAFLPQIMILFAFLGVLEDCGYMARAACLTDRWMVRLGLSGKSFIPLLSSFACAVPGIMSTRVIENDRDRLITILVAPLMTCSARLPIFALMIGAFVPQRYFLSGLLGLQGLTLAAMYALGIAAAVLVGLVLRRTILRGECPPFVMELPSYKWPSLRTIAMRVGERAWVFVRCAGTLILAMSILVWGALYYPHRADEAQARFQSEIENLEARLETLPAGAAERGEIHKQQRQLEHRLEAEYQRQSWLGRLGRGIEPVFRPLGWDWRIGAAVIASFPARETVVATLGVVFNVAQQQDDESENAASQWHAALSQATWEGTDRPLFNLPVALSLIVFYTLCAQCAATLAVIKRETNSWRWPAFTFLYMTALAYLAALVTYQAGAWLGV